MAGRVAFSVSLGLSLGLVGALGLSRFLVSLLFEIRPTDPPSLVAAVVGLATLTLAASYIPARLAANIDPMTVLRYE